MSKYLVQSQGNSVIVEADYAGFNDHGLLQFSSDFYTDATEKSINTFPVAAFSVWEHFELVKEEG